MFREHISRGNSRMRLGRQAESAYQSAAGSIRDYRAAHHDISRGPPRSYQALAPSLPPRRNYNSRADRRTPPRSRTNKSPLSTTTSSPAHGKSSRRVDRNRSSSHYSKQSYHLYMPRFWPCRNGKQLLGAAELHRLFPQLYIPSTFSHAIISEDIYKIDMNNILSFDSAFYIIDRKKDESGLFSKKLAERLNQPVPKTTGISFRHSVKVMLLSTPGAAELIKKCTDAAEAGLRLDRSTTFAHQNKMLCFLQGIKVGKSEPLGIGGQWHPVLDGSDPDKDPMVLVKTAIRCTKELLGLDLSKCKQWYKILEMRYLRPEKQPNSTDKYYDERMESTTVLMPDVWSLMPTENDWKAQQEMLTSLLVEFEETRKIVDKQTVDAKDKSEKSEDQSKSAALNSSEDEQRENREETVVVDNDEKITACNLMTDTSYEDNGEIIVTVDEVIGDCTHEIKTELEACDKEGDEEKVDVKDIKIELDLPSTPHLLINPSRIAKESLFDCKLNYLSTMLDYTSSSTKEHSFELSLFSEVFNHCLARSHALLITSSLSQMNTDVLLSLSDESGKSKMHEKPLVHTTTSATDDDNNDNSISRKKPKLSHEDCKTKDIEDNMADKHSDMMEDNKPKLQRHPNKPINSPSNKYGYSKEATGYRTIRLELLLAFSYFDYKNSRILTRKDLTRILDSTDLCLTRAEISKMVDCACGPGLTNFYYRNITDAIAPDNIPIWPLKENRFLLESNERFISTIDSSVPILDEESGFVTYHGRTVSIDGLLQAIDNNERLIGDLKVKIEMLESEIVELRSIGDSNDRHVKHLVHEIDSLREMLCERKKQLTQSKEICSRYESCFGHTRYALKRLLNRELETVADFIESMKSKEPQAIDKTSSKQDFNSEKVRDAANTDSTKLTDDLTESPPDDITCKDATDDGNRMDKLADEQCMDEQKEQSSDNLKQDCDVAMDDDVEDCEDNP